MPRDAQASRFGQGIMLAATGIAGQVYVNLNVRNNGCPGAMTHSGISVEMLRPRQQLQTDGTAP
jgi:hypothetical protein